MLTAGRGVLLASLLTISFCLAVQGYPWQEAQLYVLPAAAFRFIALRFDYPMRY